MTHHNYPQSFYQSINSLHLLPFLLVFKIILQGARKIADPRVRVRTLMPYFSLARLDSGHNLDCALALLLARAAEQGAQCPDTQARLSYSQGDL